MSEVMTKFNQSMKKSALPDVRSGDSVRVHQKIKEGKKERVQVFEGTAIRVRRMGSHTANVTVRRISSGVGVEKTYFLHSPNVTKIEILKRGKVRRNFLSYLRERQGKATRLTDKQFDREAANVQEETPKPEPKAEQKPAETKAEKKPSTEKKPAKPKEEPKAETKSKPGKEEPAKEMSKAEEKKAKAEAFRQAQESKKGK